MTLADTDGKRAAWAGLVVLGAAASIIFGLHPGRFEGQIVWYLGLLPGVVVDFFLPHPLLPSSPRLAAFVFWALVLGFSLMWYVGVSFTLIKAWRLLLGAVTARTN